MWSFIKLLLWALLWLPVWVSIILYYKVTNKPAKGNCLTWAFKRWDTDKGYLVIRWSRLNKWKWVRWPHFMWMADKDHSALQHYVPNIDKPLVKALPAIVFDGKEVQGDDPTIGEN